MTMTKQVLIFVAIYLVAAGLAHAEKLDLSAHISIIQKLESAVNVSNEDSMVQSAQIIHRLADLYAERARLLSMEDEGKGAVTYKEQISNDRNRAISYLKKILDKLNQKEKGEALLQTAHLHELLIEKDQALQIYKTIERNQTAFDSKTKSLSEIKLGDYSFAANDFEGAQLHFEKALTYAENPRKSYSHYRLAWIHYNQGRTIVAEKKLLALLQTPSLLKNSNGATDGSFIEEATHDLATFMARNNLNQTDLKTYIKIIPELLRKKNLIYLAQELDRTAKKEGALKVWAIVGTQKLSFEDQLDRQIQITKIEYDLNHLTSVTIEINKSILLLKKSDCKENPNCIIAQQNLRKVITDWARAEDRKVSAELIQAFNQYTESFEDYEMNFWAAGLASKSKKHQEAFSFYLRASTLLKDIPNRNTQQQKLFELALVGGIEMAEFAKDPKMKLKAYQRYLEFNPNGNQKNEVRYQIAHWFYDQNQYPQARDEFKKLSFDSTIGSDLREKSADLCLDTSVILNEEPRIEADSLELSKQVISKRSEYLGIYRKSVLNQTASLLNSSPDESKMKTELAKLAQIDSQSFTGEEKQLLLKNQMELAYRTKDLEALSQFSNALLAQKGLKIVDQKKAFQYLAWNAEIRMNFKEALHYLKSVQPLPKELAAYYLKVAMLKEFTSQNPTKEYELFISNSRDQNKVAFAAHQIILNSSKPYAPFNKYERFLKQKPDLYSSAALFVYEQSKDDRFAQRILNQSQFKKSAEASLVKHQRTFAEYRTLISQFSKAKLNSKSDAAIRRSLVQRNDLIRQTEKRANKSISEKDTIEQLVYLSTLAHENQRLAKEILSLPKPKQLGKAEKTKYDGQLKQLVAPYENQSLAISTKVRDIWNQTTTQNLLNDLSIWSAQINRPGHDLALQELSLLKASVQSLGLSSTAFEKLSERRQKVSTEASSLQTKIYKSPFDFSYLEKMKSLQASLGSGPMVAYLDSRIDELNSRGR